MLAGSSKDTAAKKSAHARASVGTITTAESSALDCGRSVHSRSVAESVVSKEEMFEMLKEAHPDDLSTSQHSVLSRTSTSRSKKLILTPATPKLLPKTHEEQPLHVPDTGEFQLAEEDGDWWDSSDPKSGSAATNVNLPIKQKNMLPKVQGKMSCGSSVANSVDDSMAGSTATKRLKKKRIKMRSGDSVCSNASGSVDPRLLEAMKSGKRLTAKELKDLGVNIAPRGRKKESSEDKKSRARSKSRGRPRGEDGDPKSRARSKSRGRPRGEDGEGKSRARSKSRGRARDDGEGRGRTRSKSRPRARDEESKGRGRSKSRPRAGREGDDNRSRARSKARPRSKSRPRAHRDPYDDEEDAGPIKVGMVISVETEHTDEKPEDTHADASGEKSHKPSSPLQKIKNMLSPKKNKDGKSIARSRSRRKVYEEQVDDDDDDSASLPPIPMQIVVDAEDLEKVDTVEEQPQISGNSDEMYLKMKEAGITPEQFRALAQAGLTIAEG